MHCNVLLTNGSLPLKPEPEDVIPRRSRLALRFSFGLRVEIEWEKRMNDALDRIRRKEASVNEILKYTRYDWLKKSDDLTDKERDRMLYVKSLVLQTPHAYHFKIAIQRLWQPNVHIADPI